MNYNKLTNEELTDKAEQLEESGMLGEALEFWRAAIQREPDPVGYANLLVWQKTEGMVRSRTGIDQCY